VDAQQNLAQGYYKIRLLETEERLPDDALNRRMYELRDPEELEIFVANIAPTAQPTEFQPQVFLSGFDLDENDNILDIEFYQNEEKPIPVRIVNSPPFEVRVAWEFRDHSDTILESGNITFPANALDVLQDSLDIFIDANQTLPQGTYRMILLETNERLPDDALERKMYELRDPEELNIRIKNIAPTVQPTEFQPQVFLSGFDLDEEGEIKELVFFQNEKKNIPCRIYNSPPFEVVVDWEFMTFSGVNDTILETGNITFPANALENLQDTMDITIDAEMNLTQGLYKIKLLETEETLLGDKLKRLMYELRNPDELEIMIQNIAPTVQPTEFQPQIFFGGFELDDEGEITETTFFQNDDKVVDVRIYNSPPFEIMVKWELYSTYTMVNVSYVTNVVNGTNVTSEITNTTTIEEFYDDGKITFPADALKLLQDTQSIEFIDLPLGTYTLKLFETNETLPEDKLGRPMYTLLIPYDQLEIVIEPFAPTMQPTDNQPHAFLGFYTLDNTTDVPSVEPFRFKSNLAYFLLQVRINFNVPFEIPVRWRVFDTNPNSTSETIHANNVTFPAYALSTQQDIQVVRIPNKNMTLPAGTDYYTWRFELLNSEEFMPDDTEGRRLYERSFPYWAGIEIERYSEVGFNENIETDSSIQWWLIFIICILSLSAIAIVAYFGYRYYKKYLAEKAVREQVEEDLAFEEDGIDGFYKRGNVEYTQENPLHNKRTPGVMDKSPQIAAPMMILADDDDDDFGMKTRNSTNFAQQSMNPSERNLANDSDDEFEFTFQPKMVKAFEQIRSENEIKSGEMVVGEGGAIEVGEGGGEIGRSV